MWDAYADPIFAETKVISKLTGKEIFSFDGDKQILAIPNGNLMTLRTSYAPEKIKNYEISILDDKTFKSKLNYSINLNYCDIYQYSDIELFIKGKYLYAVHDCGRMVSQFAVGNKTPMRVFRSLQGSEYRLGPVENKLVFENKNGQIQFYDINLLNQNTLKDKKEIYLDSNNTNRVLTKSNASNKISKIINVKDKTYLTHLNGIFEAYSLKTNQQLYSSFLKSGEFQGIYKTPFRAG